MPKIANVETSLVDYSTDVFWEPHIIMEVQIQLFDTKHFDIDNMQFEIMALRIKMIIAYEEFSVTPLALTC